MCTCRADCTLWIVSGRSFGRKGRGRVEQCSTLLRHDNVQCIIKGVAQGHGEFRLKNACSDSCYTHILLACLAGWSCMKPINYNLIILWHKVGALLKVFARYLEYKRETFLIGWKTQKNIYAELWIQCTGTKEDPVLSLLCIFALWSEKSNQ